MMQPAMNPINARVAEHQKQQRRETKVRHAVLIDVPIQLRPSRLDHQLERRNHKRHHRDGPHREHDLVFHLILPLATEPFRLILPLRVLPLKIPPIRQRAQRKVQRVREKRQKGPHDRKLSRHRISRRIVRVSRLRHPEHVPIDQHVIQPVSRAVEAVQQADDDRHLAHRARRARECVFAFASSRRVAFARRVARALAATTRRFTSRSTSARSTSARSRGAPACAAPRSNG